MGSTRDDDLYPATRVPGVGSGDGPRVSTFWANVDVEWIDGRTETYRVGGYARRHEAIRVHDGVLSLWLGNNAYTGPDHVASIPLDALRHWKIREGF